MAHAAATEHVEYLREKGVPGMLNAALSAAFRLRPANPRAFFASYLASEDPADPPGRHGRAAEADSDAFDEALKAYVNRTAIAGLVNAAVRDVLQQYSQEKGRGMEEGGDGAAVSARQLLCEHFLKTHYVVTAPTLSKDPYYFDVLAELQAAPVYGRAVRYDGPNATEILHPVAPYVHVAALDYSPCLKYKDASFERFAAVPPPRPTLGTLHGGGPPPKTGDAKAGQCGYAVVSAAAPAAILASHVGITAAWVEDVFHECGRLPLGESLPDYPEMRVVVTPLDPHEEAVGDNAVPTSPVSPSDARQGTRCGCSLYRLALMDCSGIDPLPYKSPHLPASEFLVKIWGPGEEAARCAARERSFYNEVKPVFARLSPAESVTFPTCYWSGVDRRGGTLLLSIPAPLTCSAPPPDASAPGYWSESVKSLALLHAAFLDPVDGVPSERLPLWAPNYPVPPDAVQAAGAGENAAWSFGSIAAAQIWGGALTEEKRALLRRALVRVLQWTGKDEVWEAHGTPTEIAAGFDSLFEAFPKACAERLSAPRTVLFSQLLHPTGVECAAPPPPEDTPAASPPLKAAAEAVPADDVPTSTRKSKKHPRQLNKKALAAQTPVLTYPFLPGARPASHPLNVSEWSVGNPAADVMSTNYAAWLVKDAPAPLPFHEVSSLYYITLRDVLLARVDARAPCENETCAAQVLQKFVKRRQAKAEADRRRAQGGLTLKRDIRSPAPPPMPVLSLEEDAVDVLQKFVLRLQAKLEATRRRIARGKKQFETPRAPTDALLRVPREPGVESSDSDKREAVQKIQRKMRARFARDEAARRKNAGSRHKDGISPALPESECMILVEDEELPPGHDDAVRIQRQVRARQARQERERKQHANETHLSLGSPSGTFLKARSPDAPPRIHIDVESCAEVILSQFAKRLLAKAELARRRLARNKAPAAVRMPHDTPDQLPAIELDEVVEVPDRAAILIQKQVRVRQAKEEAKRRQHVQNTAMLGPPKRVPAPPPALLPMQDPEVQARIIQKHYRKHQAQDERRRREVAQARTYLTVPKAPAAVLDVDDPEQRAVQSLTSFAVSVAAKGERKRRERAREAPVPAPRVPPVCVPLPDELSVEGLPTQEEVDMDCRLCSVFVLAVHIFSKLHTWLPALDTFTDDDVVILAHKGGVRWFDPRAQEPCVPEVGRQLTLAQWNFLPTATLPDGTVHQLRNYRVTRNIHDVFYQHVLQNRPEPRPESKPIPTVDLKQPIRVFREFYDVCCTPFITEPLDTRVNLVPLKMLIDTVAS